MATIHYASTINGAYLGGFSDDLPAPADSIAISPPDFAFQVWTGSSWVPDVPPNPNPVGLLTDIAYDIVLAGGPWQMLQFFYPFQMQGTASNAEIDYLRKALWAILKADTTITDWFTPTYQAKVEGWAAARHMPLL
jgi:hypothetical protein